MNSLYKKKIKIHISPFCKFVDGRNCPWKYSSWLLRLFVTLSKSLFLCPAPVLCIGQRLGLLHPPPYPCCAYPAFERSCVGMRVADLKGNHTRILAACHNWALVRPAWTAIIVMLAFLTTKLQCHAMICANEKLHSRLVGQQLEGLLITTDLAFRSPTQRFCRR